MLDENKAVDYEIEQTEVLDKATEVLDSEATQMLDDEATTLLDLPVDKQVRKSGAKKLEMLEEVMLIHTSEVI